MMKKVTLLYLLFYVGLYTAYADPQYKIKFAKDSTAFIQTRHYEISVSATIDSEEECGELMIELTNRTEGEYLFLFGQSYSEKQLKGLDWKLYFDKGYPGTKGNRKTEVSTGVQRARKIDSPQKTERMPLIKMKNGDVEKVTLAIYRGKKKRWGFNKYVIKHLDIQELEFELALKPDEIYVKLAEEVQSFKTDISNQQFCRHPRHKPALQIQEQPYEDRRDTLLAEIDRMIKQHSDGDFINTKGKRYETLRDIVNSISLSDFEIDNCGNTRLHKTVGGHHCKYCKLSLDGILHELSQYYNRIYAKKVTKSAVINDVRSLYSCCTNISCKSHAKEWKRGGKVKQRIVEYYKAINNLKE